MAFPSSPSNGQRATVNDIIYEYNSTKGAWLRVSAQGFTSANLTVGGIITDNYYRADGTSLLGVNKSVYNGTAAATTSATLVDSVPTAGNTSVTWSLTSKDTDNSTYKNSVVSSLNDGTNVYYSEYGIILSNASVSVSTFTSNIVAGNLRLYAVGDSANVTITFQRTLLGTSTDVGYLTAGSRGAQGPTGNVSYGNTEVAAYLTDYTGNIGNLNTTGNVITTGYFIGNGSQLTGLPVSYGNTEVASYLPTYSGNIGGNINIGGTLRIYSANSAPFTTNDALYVGGGLTTLANISSGGRLVACSFATSTNINSGAIQTNGGIGAWGNVYAGENVVATGNVSATYFIGNGSQLTGLPVSYGNTEVAAYLPTYSGNLSALNANITNSANIAGLLISSANIQMNPGSGGGHFRIINGYGGGFRIDGLGPKMGLGTTANVFAFLDIWSINNNNYINSTTRPLVIGFSPSSAGANVLYMDPARGNTVLNTNTASISSATGALVIAGGVGIAGNLNVGGEINTSKTVTALNILNPFLLAGM